VRALPAEVAALVEAAGGVPEPFDSELQFRRYHHQDLVDLSDDMLEGERVLVMLAWSALVRNFWVSATDPALVWFTERRASVAAAVARRQQQQQRSRR
jgi:hypothetical protein